MSTSESRLALEPKGMESDHGGFEHAMGNGRKILGL
jgi:hypothetical protein